MDRVEGKGIVVPEALLRAGAVVAEDEQGVCVYVDAEAGEDVAELARQFLGGNTVSGINNGVVWYRPLTSVPGLMEALVGSHDDDIAKAREAGRQPATNEERQRAINEAAAAALAEAPLRTGEIGRFGGFTIIEGPVDAGDERSLEREYTRYLEGELDRQEMAASRAVIALLRLARSADGTHIDANERLADELAHLADELVTEFGL